jgi:hypothetical protein
MCMNRSERRRQHKNVLVVSPNSAHARAGNYFSSLLAAGVQSEPGTVSEAIIRHDDWCDLLTSRGPCNCNPEIQITELGR